MAAEIALEKLHITPENAVTMRLWLDTRGGLALWRSINLSNPGATWTTPALELDGTPKQKPTWQAANTPERVITDPADVVVDVPKLVKRFHVAVRMGGTGLTLKLTDASTRKVRQAVDKAGDGAWYEFDYSSQEALVFAPERTVPLSDFEVSHA